MVAYRRQGRRRLWVGPGFPCRLISPFMPDENKPRRAAVSPSATGTSQGPGEQKEEQLSGRAGVRSECEHRRHGRKRSDGVAGVSPGWRRYNRQLLEVYTDAGEIMLRVKAGDESAFNYLVQKYRRPLVSFMYRMARNTAAAEDLAQEVFLRVYRSRQSYEASAKFTTWLYRIATNLAVNHARDTRKDRPEVTVSLDEPDEETGTTMDVRRRHDDGRRDDGVARADAEAIRSSKVEGAALERQRLAVIHAQVSARWITSRLPLY